MFGLQYPIRAALISLTVPQTARRGWANLPRDSAMAPSPPPRPPPQGGRECLHMRWENDEGAQRTNLKGAGTAQKIVGSPSYEAARWFMCTGEEGAKRIWICVDAVAIGRSENFRAVPVPSPVNRCKNVNFRACRICCLASCRLCKREGGAGVPGSEAKAGTLNAHEGHWIQRCV